MALYLKAAGGNWSAAGSWSTTGSGGGDSSGPPTAATDVILELGSGQLTIDATAACQSLTAAGAVTDRLLVQSSVVGTARTLTVTNAPTLSYVDFRDITAAGAGGTWAGTSLGDCLGNSNITFTAPVTRYAVAGGNWSSTATWSATNGGASGATVPLPQDTVYINNNLGAMGSAYPGGSYPGEYGAVLAMSSLITMDMPRLGANIDFTGAGGGTAYAGALGGSIAITSYGSLAFSASMTLSFALTWTLAGRSSHTLTSNGKPFPNSLSIVNPNGTYTLADAGIVTAGSFNLSYGTFSSAGFSIAARDLQWITPGDAAHPTLTGMGATTISIGGTNQSSTIRSTSSLAGTTITYGASASTRTFVGSGGTYGTFTYTVAGSTGQLTITGANTFGPFDFSDASNARTIVFPASTTTTFTTAPNLRGTAGKLMTINSSIGGTPATLSMASGVVVGDYLSIKDSTATGGADWFPGANSTNVSGNSGWRFGELVGVATLTLDALVGVETGTVDVVGVLTQTLDALALVSTGQVEVAGAATLTLDAVTGAATGTVDVAGSLAQTLDALTALVSGTVEVHGDLSSVLDALTVIPETVYRPVARPGDRYTAQLRASRTSTGATP